MKFEIGALLGGLGFILIGVCFLLAAWAGLNNSDELDQEQALYCEMVETFKTTGGEYGWPDYKGVYQEACK